MSSIIDKKYERYRQYLSSDREFRATLATYSIPLGTLAPPGRQQQFEEKWPLGGVPLGSSEDARLVYVDRSDSHTLVVGPTGSKKSRLVVMPTIRILAAAGESMIVCDPKGEIYQDSYQCLTNNNYDIIVIDLRNPEYGNCWNPLAVPYNLFCSGHLDSAYAMVSDIATNLIGNKSIAYDPFWDNSAGQLFYGLALLLFRRCHEQGLPTQCANLANLLRLRNWLFGEDQIDYRNVTDSTVWQYIKDDLVLSSALMGTLVAPEKTRASILSTFDSKLQVFVSRPQLLEMLSDNTVDANTFREVPTAVFLVLPDEKTSHYDLASLFIKQTYEIIINRYHNLYEDNNSDLRLNYILDEFSSLPTISDFPAMMTASRSRGIRFTLVIQSKHQLLLRYHEEANTIMSNCSNWIFLTSRELELLREVSTLCGETTGDRCRPVLTIADLQYLDKERGEALIMKSRYKPYLTRYTDIDEFGNSQQVIGTPTREHNEQSYDIDFEGFMSIHGRGPIASSVNDDKMKIFDDLYGTTGLSEITNVVSE